ncbi:DUF1566 domain-containing protein [Billgrantia ethanolica]|uniref:DUF1566 domain-containing protein n=1 Tax=Billgrantia ethanolica TaxID=2733486 RepID=A0ABS9A7D1_9GAMM|nr:DUF1566 domain-containing protein [Halomonas ethanolica]MCE8004729.1 DUF1566 domain-containing protein [Halomonas ethanolica]
MKLRLVVASLLLGFSAAAWGNANTGYDASLEGWVVDSKQQLVWMRCSLGQEYREGRCLGEAERFNWSEAQARIDTLASAECPWRLPRFHELRGLMQPSNEATGSVPMAIDLEYFPDTPQGWYWNEVSAGGHSQQDCFVDFGGEGRTRCNMGGQFYLRPVMALESAAAHCPAP